VRYLVDENLPRVPDEEQFTLDGWIDLAPFERLIGLVIERAEAGQAVLHLPFTVKLSQGGGVMHGGALTTLADTAVAMAIKSLLPEGTRFATTELNSRFLAPLLAGRVTAHARISAPEGRTFSGEAVLTDEDGRSIMTFSAIFRVAKGSPLPDNI